MADTEKLNTSDLQNVAAGNGIEVSAGQMRFCFVRDGLTAKPAWTEKSNKNGGDFRRFVSLVLFFGIMPRPCSC